MPTFLSPGVFPREIDLSLVPSNVGPLRPVFIGTASKGPVNIPTFISNSQQAIDTFGEPFPESYLMYAVMAYMERGNQCYIVRVGVECEDGQAEELDDICIDTSGNRVSGWARIPIFTGIDFGRITLREISADSPYVFHDSGVENIDYNDQSVSDTDGPTTATLNFAGGTAGSDDYTGCLDESYILLITGDPDDGEAVAGCTYECIRNSDSAVVATGTLTDLGGGTSNNIDVGDGLVFSIVVSAGRLEENDTFTFQARPDNRTFSFSVEGGVATEYTMTAGTYTDITDFVDDFNTLVGAGEDYIAIERTTDEGLVVPQIRTDNAARRIQLMTTCNWAAEVGSEQYAWDIPRSYLLGTDGGPFSITSSNNRVVINVIPQDNADSTVRIEASLATGLGLDAGDIASQLDLSGTVAGENYYESFDLMIPAGSTHLIVITHLDHMLDQLEMLASYSNLKTLRFAEEVGIPFPYTRAYRGFNDFRLSLPASGETTPETPLSCETDPFSDECASDTAYFENIVGWLVGVSAGTWLNNYTATLEIQTVSVGDAAGRYQLTVKDIDGFSADLVQDISFDKTEDRYIGNLINPGTTFGGQNGNEFYNWEERPTFLDNDPLEDDYEVRQPSTFADRDFDGGANGIPTDPAFSSELDAAIIGNPAEATGLYSMTNAETFDINLLIIPGFSSGAVIGQGLQFCESRGDCLYIVDPPFGLRPQQVVDWHNGMLLSDLSRAINSSYGALYWGWEKIFDQFNEQNIWIPPSGHVASVFAYTAATRDMWWAPAGLERGRLLTTLELEYNPSKGERDLLYGSGNAVNPLVSFPQDGVVVWGQRTLQRSETALSRVNVRMLLIYLKKNLVRILRNYVFEPNDPITWKRAENAVDPFMAEVQARRGLDGYRVVIDETNNTPIRRDRNQLWVSIFLKPTRAIEFVVLNLVILQSSASFNSEEVLASGGIVTR